MHFFYGYESLLCLSFICFNIDVINSFITLELKTRNMYFGHFLYFNFKISIRNANFEIVTDFENFYFIKESNWRHKFYLFVYHSFMKFVLCLLN